MGSHNGLRTTITAQLQQIVECRLGARQDDDVGTTDIAGIVSIEEVHARIPLQRVKVCKVTDVSQEYDRDVHLPFGQLSPFLFEAYAVLLVDKYIAIVRHHP